jgi:hypothetical protein
MGNNNSVRICERKRIHKRLGSKWEDNSCIRIAVIAIVTLKLTTTCNCGTESKDQGQCILRGCWS